MKLPAVTLGLDVVSPEQNLPEGAVRRATNVELDDLGGFQRRPGLSTFIALPNAHSFWRSPAQTRALCVSEGTLYDVDLVHGTTASILTGLPDEPVSYEEIGPDIYLTTPGFLRRITPAGLVRRPGVSDTFGTQPAVSTTLGGLLPGRYGVAYSLIADTGEESPISAIAWIDISSGGILLSGLLTADNVTHVRLYVTSANGEDLYHHDTRPFAASYSITDRTLKKPASRQYRMAMPWGSIIRLYNGRLYVVSGKSIWASDPLDYGVCSVKGGWMTFNRTITMFEPVRTGIFIGLRERTIFLQGAHESFVQINTSNHGAFEFGSVKVAPDFFRPELVPNRDNPVAVWCSEVGLAIGQVDGSIAYPQADRVRMTGGVSRPLFAQHRGIKQGIFCVEELAVATPADLTI